MLSSSNSGFLRGLANASQALGGVSSAAGDLVGAGANMTVKFTTISLEAVSTAQHAAAEFYFGVDVLDIKIHRSTLRCISFSQSALSIWLANRSEFPNDVRDRFVQDLMSLSADVPVIEVSHEHILLNGSFVQSWVRGRRRCDDSVALALVVLVSEFSARWTSPHWDWVGFDVQSEAGKILEKLKIAMAGLGAVSHALVAIDDQTLRRDFNFELGWVCAVPKYSHKRFLVVSLLFFMICLFRNKDKVALVWGHMTWLSMKSLVIGLYTRFCVMFDAFDEDSVFFEAAPFASSCVSAVDADDFTFVVTDVDN